MARLRIEIDAGFAKTIFLDQDEHQQGIEVVITENGLLLKNLYADENSVLGIGVCTLVDNDYLYTTLRKENSDKAQDYEELKNRYNDAIDENNVLQEKVKRLQTQLKDLDEILHEKVASLEEQTKLLRKQNKDMRVVQNNYYDRAEQAEARVKKLERHIEVSEGQQDIFLQLKEQAEQDRDCLLDVVDAAREVDKYADTGFNPDMKLRRALQALNTKE